jgi:hypothetical protein
MELRTIVNTKPSPVKITYNNGTLFIGSCFASSIGQKMESGRLPVMINPAGAVYNPVSVCNTLDIINTGKQFTIDDLYNNNGTYLSFYHYTDFSSEDPSLVLNKINSRSTEALAFLNSCSFLFITFGTARVYRLKSSGEIVSNCHKLQASLFETQLLTINQIVELWGKQLDRLHTLFPSLKIVFTVSPIRHWKDGAHGNQVSKSVLFLAIEELLKHSASPDYFPSYELVMDDLRDYRFYNDDMLHPSDLAINYIWEAFSGTYFDNVTLNTYKEVLKITKAASHRIINDSGRRKNEFAEIMLKKISEIERSVSSIKLSSERNYFQSLLK